MCPPCEHEMLQLWGSLPVEILVADARQSRIICHTVLVCNVKLNACWLESPMCPVFLPLAVIADWLWLLCIMGLVEFKNSMPCSLPFTIAPLSRVNISICTSEYAFTVQQSPQCVSLQEMFAGDAHRCSLCKNVIAVRSVCTNTQRYPVSVAIGILNGLFSVKL